MGLLSTLISGLLMAPGGANAEAPRVMGDPIAESELYEQVRVEPAGPGGASAQPEEGSLIFIETDDDARAASARAGTGDDPATTGDRSEERLEKREDEAVAQREEEDDDAANGAAEGETPARSQQPTVVVVPVRVGPAFSAQQQGLGQGGLPEGSVVDSTAGLSQPDGPIFEDGQGVGGSGIVGTEAPRFGFGRQTPGAPSRGTPGAPQQQFLFFGDDGDVRFQDPVTGLDPVATPSALNDPAVTSQPQRSFSSPGIPSTPAPLNSQPFPTGLSGGTPNINTPAPLNMTPLDVGPDGTTLPVSPGTTGTGATAPGSSITGGSTGTTPGGSTGTTPGGSTGTTPGGSTSPAAPGTTR